jgi:hypothetical protein
MLKLRSLALGKDYPCTYGEYTVWTWNFFLAPNAKLFEATQGTLKKVKKRSKVSFWFLSVMPV